METVSLTRVLIHNAQDPATASFESPDMDEIPSPYMSRIGGLLQVSPSGLPQSPLLFLWRWNQEPFLSPNLSDSIIADFMALISQQPPNFIRSPFRVFMTKPDNGLLRNKRMISSGLCLFCFIVSCFDYSKLLTRFGPVFQAASNSSRSDHSNGDTEEIN
jgi:hypothetical protein